MTWALAKFCKLFAACNALRTSLKLLKNTSLPHPKLHIKKVEILMFWAIYGVFVVFETYLEWTIRWLPMYYYFKALLLVVLSFPSLRITTLVFHTYIIPLCDNLHNCLHANDAAIITTNPWAVIKGLPFLVTVTLFPFFYEDNSSAAVASSAIDARDAAEEEAKEEEAKVEAEAERNFTYLTPPKRVVKDDTSPAEVASPPIAHRSNNKRTSLETMREMLTGAPTTKIRDTIFNIHTPPPTYFARHQPKVPLRASPKVFTTSVFRADVSRDFSYEYSPMHNDYRSRKSANNSRRSRFDEFNDEDKFDAGVTVRRTARKSRK